MALRLANDAIVSHAQTRSTQLRWSLSLRRQTVRGGRNHDGKIVFSKLMLFLSDTFFKDSQQTFDWRQKKNYQLLRGWRQQWWACFNGRSAFGVFCIWSANFRWEVEVRNRYWQRRGSSPSSHLPHDVHLRLLQAHRFLREHSRLVRRTGVSPRERHPSR